jgi:hypothetical protein
MKPVIKFPSIVKVKRSITSPYLVPTSLYIDITIADNKPTINAYKTAKTKAY